MTDQQDLEMLSYTYRARYKDGEGKTEKEMDTRMDRIRVG